MVDTVLSHIIALYLFTALIVGITTFSTVHFLRSGKTQFFTELFIATLAAIACPYIAGLFLRDIWISCTEPEDPPHEP